MPDPIKVYHVKDKNFFDPPTHEWPDQFTQVAEIERTSDFGGMQDEEVADEAYVLTNHHSGSWWENDGVTLIGEKTRSTSVGDVIVVGDRAFLVAPVGFKEIK